MEKDQKKQRQYTVTDDIPDILVSSCLLFRHHTLLLYLRNPRSPQNQSAPAASVLSLPDDHIKTHSSLYRNCIPSSFPLNICYRSYTIVPASDVS